MIQDCTIDAQMRCKTASYKKEAMITLINYRRTTQKIHDDLAENPQCGYPEPWKEKIKEEYAIALSLEPTMEEINDLPSDNKKGTELEMILMELNDLTINFTKREEKVRKDALKGLNQGLTKYEEINDSQNAKFLREKIKALKDEFIVKECAKRKNFTILEDKRPTKTFLNIESRKQGYNEIDKLVLHNHNSNNSNDKPKTYETTDQDTIRKATKTFYQKIYDKNNSVNPTKQSIKEFLDMDGNTSPWEALNNKRIPKEMAESMEGDLTPKELEEALYLHMN